MIPLNKELDDFLKNNPTRKCANKACFCTGACQKSEDSTLVFTLEMEEAK